MALDTGNGACREHDDGWEDPIAFDSFEAPVFPIDVLPPWAKAWCVEMATALQVPIDLPAMLVLAVISLCIAKKIGVCIKPGWTEPTNIYTAITLGVGEGKSPAFTHATEPVYDWEEEKRAKLAPQIADAQEQRHLLDERRKRARQTAARSGNTPKGKSAEEEARGLAVELDGLDVPVLPRLVADDATPEAVGRLLAEQGGRLGIFSSEGGPFAILAGRYSEGRANLELFCKSYSGDPYTLDRMGRPSLHVRAPLLTIALTVQPSVIAGLAGTQEMRGQGLLARFLYAVPLSKVGLRDADPPSMAAATAAAYVAAIRTLLDLEAETNDDDEIEPRTIPLADDARDELIAFKRRLEPRLGETGDLRAIADWGNKLTGTTARLACVLHVAEHIGADPFDPFVTIQRMTVLRAIAIADYAIEHARAAFGVMGADPTTELAKHVLAWVLRQGDDEVSQRDIHRGVHSQVRRAADLEKPIAILVERGYLRPLDATPTGGRPKSPTYAVNPRAKR